MGAKIPNSAQTKRLRTTQTDDDGAPLLATSDVFDTPASFKGQRRQKEGATMRGAGHAGQTSSRTPGRINLKTVAEACADAGLDPAVEIARVLSTKVPVLDAKGKPKVDKEGNPITVDLIDADTKIRTLTELLQYNQPKLKAVEMKVSGSLELSSDELDQRLAALLAKAVS